MNNHGPDPCPSRPLQWSIQVTKPDGSKQLARDSVLRFIELAFYVSHIPEEFWTSGKFEEPMCIPAVNAIPHRYRYHRHTDIMNFDPRYAKSSLPPFTPATFYSYVEDLRWNSETHTLWHEPSGYDVCIDRPFSHFKASCIRLYDANILPNNTEDLIQSVQDESQFYFIDAATFADYFINGTPLPDVSEFGCLDDSWTEDYADFSDFCDSDSDS
ncbi:hypothetical protein AAF712_007869 [Marasmius tenuissimus]|uniref:Uncharacterized protein n=1 Tax=Marasmius tenuissimus TaxID=585030 RepID=A0ABR2ZWN7_9AGAR